MLWRLLEGDADDDRPSPNSTAPSPASRRARYWTATFRSKVTPPPPVGYGLIPPEALAALGSTRVSSSQERSTVSSVLRCHRSARPSRLDLAKPASRSLPSAAVAVVGATPSAVATIRPDIGFGLVAKTLKAL